MTSVQTSSKIKALLLGAAEIIPGDTSWIDDIKPITEDNIKTYFFDTDQVIEAYEIR